MPNRQDKRIVAAIVAGCVSLPLLMLCVLAALATQLARTKTLHRQVVQSFATSMELSRVFSLTQDAETGQRGYILTGQLSFLQPYTEAKVKLGYELQRLDGMIGGEPAQGRDAAQLNVLVRLKLRELESTVGLRREDRTADAVAIVETGEGKALMDRIRVIVAHMREAIGRETTVAMSDDETMSSQTNMLIGALLGALGLLVIGAAALGFATLTKRIELINILGRQKDEADRANQVKSDFLSNMSHELRTPLTSIVGFTRLAAEQPDLVGLTRTYVERVGDASRALLCTVNDILDFSKLEVGQVSFQTEPTSLARLARSTLDLFTPQAAAKDLDLTLDCEVDDLVLRIDPDRFRQILLNLVGNAVKFTDSGEITLRTRYDRSTGTLSVDIIDTGAGIPPEKLDLLFKRFSQVDGSLTRTHGGTGLGLAICKGLIEAMGGEIGVDSRIGQGSRFWFTVPAVLSALAPAAANGSSPALPTFTGVRVLVADDHPANRELARLILAGVGAEVSEASDGEEAAELAAT